MKKGTKGAVIAAVAVGLVLAFFLAPVFFFGDYYGTLLGSRGRVSVYRSAGCIFLGIGDTYVAATGSGPYFADKPGVIWGCPYAFL